MEKRTRILGNDHPKTLDIKHNLALAATYWAQGHLPKAAGLQEEVLKKRKRYGNTNPDTLRAMMSLALTYTDQGRTGEAAELDEKVLEEGRRIFGEDNPLMLKVMNNLASTYRVQGHPEKAALLQRELLEKRMVDQPYTVTSEKDAVEKVKQSGGLLYIFGNY